MILKKNKYLVQYEPIKVWLDNHPNDNLIELIGRISVGTGCPIIIVCEFIKEIRGTSTELLAFQDRLKLFYGVTDVS